MKYKFVSFRINVTENVVTFGTKEHYLFTLSIRHVVCTTGTEICRAYTQPIPLKKVGRRGLSEPTPDGKPGGAHFRGFAPGPTLQ